MSLRFVDTEIAGVFLVLPEMRQDERGAFGRTFCARTFAERGLASSFVQISTSYNRRAGTVRGMHYQAAPHEETKLVRCTASSIHDVVLDLRRDSPTYLQSTAVNLSAENRQTLYIPPGVAHGFQTLADDAEVLYCISAEYHADFSRGVRWDDEAFSIRWPREISMISERDRTHPVYRRE